jgi:hypothetical protein
VSASARDVSNIARTTASEIAIENLFFIEYSSVFQRMKHFLIVGCCDVLH